MQALILRQPVYDMDRRRLEWTYRSYYGTISHIDREVGAILQALAETGQAERHDRRLRLGPRRPDDGTRADGQELLLRGVGPRAADDPPAGPRAPAQSTTNWWKPSI